MQDFGKNRFNKIYNKDNLYKLLKIAVENIIVIQNESNLNNLKNLKEYNFEDLKIELNEFVTYYIPSNKKTIFPTSKFYELWKSMFFSQNYNMKNFAHKDFEFVNLFFLENYKSHLYNLKNLKEYNFEDLKIELKEFVTYYTSTNKKSNFPTSKFYETWKSIFYSQNYNMKNFVHKDFEFVNLFFLENYESHLQCGIIDFQSAFMGFIGWDLISLLENPRINFTRDYNDELIEYFYDNAPIIENFNTFREQYYVLSLARQTRLLGRWRKLLITNNDNQYLDYLKITKSRIVATLNKIKNYELRSIYEKYL